VSRSKIVPLQQNPLSFGGALHVKMRAPRPQPETALSYAGVSLFLGAMVFGAGPARGWVGMLGILLMAGVFAFGRTGMPRYASASYALMFCGMAASFGLSLVWPDRPRWSDDVYRYAMLVSFVGAGRYLWTRRGQRGAA
jgi:hypothetical protein